MKGLALVFLILLSQAAQGQSYFPTGLKDPLPNSLRSMFNDVIEPPADALTDSLSGIHIIWASAIEQNVDILNRQTTQGTIAQSLVQQVLEKKFQPYYFSDRDEIFPLTLKNKKLYSADDSATPVCDLTKEGKGYGAGSEDEQYAFAFIEYVCWNWDTRERPAAIIPYAGIACLRGHSASTNLFYIPLKEAGEARQTKKVLWETDHYFEEPFRREDDTIREQEWRDFAHIIVSYAEEGYFYALADTDGVSELTPETFSYSYVDEPDTFYYEPGMGVQITWPESSDNIKYFGVWQHITIYDDWTAHVEIKGLRVFAAAYQNEPKPIAWIYFGPDE